MPSKKKLLAKLYQNGIPKNFTTNDLDQLMSKCNCSKYSGGRGSAIKYYHSKSGRILQFNAPHPGKELYAYHIRMVRDFISDIGEDTEDKDGE